MLWENRPVQGSKHGSTYPIMVEEEELFPEDGRISGYFDTKYIAVLQIEQLLHNFNNQKNANFFNQVKQAKGDLNSFSLHTKNWAVLKRSGVNSILVLSHRQSRGYFHFFQNGLKSVVSSFGYWIPLLYRLQMQISFSLVLANTPPRWSGTMRWILILMLITI